MYKSGLVLNIVGCVLSIPLSLLFFIFLIFPGLQEMLNINFNVYAVVILILFTICWVSTNITCCVFSIIGLVKNDPSYKWMPGISGIIAGLGNLLILIGGILVIANNESIQNNNHESEPAKKDIKET